ncbi:MAG: M50 family metallopeptidase [Chloroflexota bacterium]
MSMTQQHVETAPKLEASHVATEVHQLKGFAHQIVMDSSENQESYLLIGTNGRHMRLSPTAYALLQKIHSGLSYDEISTEINHRQHTQITASEVEAAHQRILEQITEIEQRPQKAMFGMWMRFRILPDKIVGAMVRPLTSLFSRPVVMGLLALIAAAICAIIWQRPSFQISPMVFWEAYLLFLLSLMVHELGHASACARYGATPGEIGFGIYWLYPVFYSDVSAAWSLKRWQRVVVDLGGVYLQFGVGVVYIALYLLFQWEAAFVAVLQILYSAVFALNPILKFDGYWVLSDAFGVTNLSQQPKRIIQHGINRFRGRANTALPWSTGTIVFVLLYTVASILFWGYFTWRILPFAIQTIASYPTLLFSILRDLVLAPHAISAAHVQSLGMSTFIACITLLMLFRIGYPLLRSILSAVVPMLARLKSAILRQAGHRSSRVAPDS